MNITPLMSDKTARDYYLETPATTSPETLADLHTYHTAKNNSAKALAIETHVRQLAMVHFHRPGVLECLNQVERNCKRRKLGTSGAPIFKNIASEIEDKYLAGDYLEIDNGERLQFSIGKTTIRCRNGADISDY